MTAMVALSSGKDFRLASHLPLRLHPYCIRYEACSAS